MMPDSEINPLPPQSELNHVEMLSDGPLIVRTIGDAPFVIPASDDLSSKAQFGILGVLGLGVALILVEGAIAVPIAILGAIAGVLLDPIFQFGVQAFASVVGSIALCAMLLRGDFVRALALRGCRPGQMALVVLLAIAIGPLAHAVSMLVGQSLGWEPMVGARPSLFEQLDQYYAALARLPWPFALLFGCFAPAIAEELFFRGLVGRALIGRYGALAGVLITSLLFALAHIDPIRIAGTFVLGLVLHFAFLATRSILAAMTLHCIYNFIAIFGMKLTEIAGWDMTGQFSSMTHYGMLLITSILATTSLLCALWRTRTQWRLQNGAVWPPGRISAESPPRNLIAGAEAQPLGFRLLATVAASIVGLGGALCLAARPSPGWQAYHLKERGNHLYSSGDMPGAVAAYDEALQLTPDDYLTIGNRGLAYVQMVNAPKALVDLNRAIELGGPDAEWLANRGWANMSLGNYVQAMADCDQALAIDHNCADARRFRAFLFRQRGNDSARRGTTLEAIEYYTAALTDEPNHPNSLGNRGMCYVDRGELERGLDDLDKAITLAPGEPEWRLIRGRCHSGMNNFDKALVDFDAVIELRPNDPEPRAQRGWVLLNQEQWKAALNELDFAIRLGSDTADVHAGRGRALFRLHQYSEAATVLEAALKRRPDHLIAAYDLAWLRASCPDAELRSGQRAVELARSLCEASNWSSSSPLSTLAAAEAECGRFDEAVHWQERAVQLAVSGRGFYQRALELYQAGKPYRLDTEK